MSTAKNQRQPTPTIMIWRTGGVILIAVLAMLIAASHASATGHETITGTATARMHLIKVNGSRLTEEGPVTGALNGSAHAELDTGAVFTATFTIATRAGSITGQGKADPHGNGRYQSFSGSFLATKGTGRYTHITGRAALYGVFDRRTDAVVIETTGGQLTY